MAETKLDGDDVWPSYMTDKRVKRAIKIAQDTAVWNEDKLYGIELHSSEPDHMAVVAFAVVHEHQKSCLLLINSGLVASAMALMRPSFEAFMRGLWLHWATDDELLRYQRGEDSLNLERAIKLIAQRSGIVRYNDLLDMWSQSKRTLHGYVHHSYQSLIRRSGVMDVPPDEIASVLNFSSGLATHASIELTELMDKFPPPGREVERRNLVNQLQGELMNTLYALRLAELPQAAEAPTVAAGRASEVANDDDPNNTKP